MHSKDHLTTAQLGTISKGNCPACDNRGFVIGPQGGRSINIECADPACRSRYFVVFMSGAAMMGHILQKRSEGALKWPSEP